MERVGRKPLINFGTVCVIDSETVELWGKRLRLAGIQAPELRAPREPG